MSYKRLSKKKEKELERTNFEEYQRYYKYMRDLYEKSRIANLSLETRKKLYPFLYKLLVLMNKLNGNKLCVLDDRRIETSRPKIYAVTHIGKYDIEVISEAIKEHTYILSGDFENLHGILDGTFLEVNGILYVNENDKKDRRKIKQVMKDKLTAGANIMYFPEGTWNMSPNLLMLKLFPGILEVALETGAEIIPVGIEQYGKQFYAIFGENMDPISLKQQGYSDSIILDTLRDTMASLKWEIFEHVPKWEYSEIADDYYESYLQERISEWPGFTLEEVRGKEYKAKGEYSPDEVFAHLDNLIVSKENAFLLRKTR